LLGGTHNVTLAIESCDAGAIIRPNVFSNRDVSRTRRNAACE
jgi:hypothetical protein